MHKMVILLAALAGCDGSTASGDACDEKVDGWIDVDRDGYGAGEAEPVCPGTEGYAEQALDCDDENPEVHPGVEEQCNGIDDDCNGTPDNGLDSTTFYADEDGDGFGTRFPAEVGCQSPEGSWSRNDDDCDDTTPLIHPEAAEVCNGGIDDDCNTLADDADPRIDPTSRPRWFRDADADGYGDRTEFIDRCLPQAGYVDDNRDCNDVRSTVNPDATEVCNGVDDNCDHNTDDADPLLDPSTQQSFYADADGDGYGDGAVEILACEAIPGLSSPSPDDCDDTRPQVHPNAQEQLCDTVDNDCDAGTADDRDADGDTFSICAGDCADQDGTISPGADEEPGDGVDQNCNALEACYVDADLDGARSDDVQEIADRTCRAVGYADASAPLDCDDADPGVDVEVGWYDDLDGDGFGAGSPVLTQCLNPGGGLVHESDPLDCDDADPAHSPATVEVCNDAIDQDCDLQIDCDDPDCTGAPGCLLPCADLDLGSQFPVVMNGNTTGRGNDTIPGCNLFSTADDVAFQWVPPANGNYTVDTFGSGYDTMLYVLDGCGGVELGCNDDTGGLQSQVRFQGVAGVPVIIVVDGYAMNSGQFVLNIN